MSEASNDHQLRQRLMERLTGDGDVDGLRTDMATLVDDVMANVVDVFQKETGLVATPALLERVRVAAGRALAVMYPGIDEVLAKKGESGSGSDGGKEAIGGGAGEPSDAVPEAVDDRSLYEQIPLTTLAEGALAGVDGDMSTVFNRVGRADRASVGGDAENLPDLRKSLRVAEVLKSLGVDFKTCNRYEGPQGVPGCKIIEATVDDRRKLIFVSDRFQIATFVAHGGDVSDFSGKSLEVWHEGFKGGTVSRLSWVKRPDYIDGWKERLADILKSESGKEFQVTNPAEVTVEMDSDYFHDGRYVRNDLLKFVVALGVDSSFDLTTGADSLWGLRVKCTNNECINGETYLMRAAKAYGYVEKGTRKYEYKKTLSMLLTVAGYCVRDKSYYLDSRAVKADLEQFLGAYNAGLSGDKCLDNLSELKANGMLDFSIICSNDETVKGLSYLRRAAVLFGFGDAEYKRTLDRLREIASAA